jgi:hypothetical protein
VTMIEEPVHPLSLGSVVGGSTRANRAWRDAVRAVTEQVIDARTGVESPLNVNVVFQVPGNIITPDFSGVRTGGFSKPDKLLMVQVALPEEVPPDAERYLRDAAHDALDEAERWANKRGIASDLASLRAILDRA